MRFGLAFLMVCLSSSPAVGAASKEVAVDVGHFLDKPGVISVTGIPEFEYNRNLAFKVRDLLLSSGVTITLAHWGLIANSRSKLLLWQGLTILLGVAFLICQAIEYSHAYSELNLKLTTGAYGTTFFMLTGFHGFHVTCGAIMLTVIWFRCLSGHFKPEHHFAFEGVAWYWHFVDVVWLGLFIFVYWL